VTDRSAPVLSGGYRQAQPVLPLYQKPVSRQINFAKESKHLLALDAAILACGWMEMLFHPINSEKITPGGPAAAKANG
jgi:hypothetical protein